MIDAREVWGGDFIVTAEIIEWREMIDHKPDLMRMWATKDTKGWALTSNYTTRLTKSELISLLSDPPKESKYITFYRVFRNESFGVWREDEREREWFPSDNEAIDYAVSQGFMYLSEEADNTKLYSVLQEGNHGEKKFSGDYVILTTLKRGIKCAS